MGGIQIAKYREAYEQGYNAWWATNGNPWCTKNPYSKDSRKYREFNSGWNDARRAKNSISTAFLKPITA